MRCRDGERHTAHMFGGTIQHRGSVELQRLPARSLRLHSRFDLAHLLRPVWRGVRVSRGQQSLLSNATCTRPCPAGTYGAASALTSPTCSGQATRVQRAVLMPPSFCALQGSSARGGGARGPTHVCTGAWTPGYACPHTSTTPTALPCSTGRYSVAGSEACVPCAGGWFSGEWHSLGSVRRDPTAHKVPRLL
jgi:hypothetical protein